MLFRRAAEPREQSLNFWFEFGPQQLGWGMGFWGENRPVMDRFRRELAARPQKFLDLLEDCDLPGHHLGLSGAYFKRLTIPEGLPPEAESWYRMRELWVSKVNPGIIAGPLTPGLWIAFGRITRLLRHCISCCGAWRMRNKAEIDALLRRRS